MHFEVRKWLFEVALKHPTYFFGKRVLECGSLNINGSPISHFFFCKYIGIDICKGKGVDVVCGAHELREKNYWDVVVCCEMAEHDFHWRESLRCMYDALTENGLMIFTCASYERLPHGVSYSNPQDSPMTNNYYQNLGMSDFFNVLEPKLFRNFKIRYKRNGQDLMMYGIKK